MTTWPTIITTPAVLKRATCLRSANQTTVPDEVVAETSGEAGAPRAALKVQTGRAREAHESAPSQRPWGGRSYG